MMAELSVSLQERPNAEEVRRWRPYKTTPSTSFLQQQLFLRYSVAQMNSVVAPITTNDPILVPDLCSNGTHINYMQSRPTPNRQTQAKQFHTSTWQYICNSEFYTLTIRVRNPHPLWSGFTPRLGLLHKRIFDTQSPCCREGNLMLPASGEIDGNFVLILQLLSTDSK